MALGGVSHDEDANIPLKRLPGGGEKYPSRWKHGVKLTVLANLAHELRHPVQALLGYVEILRDEVSDTLPLNHRRIISRLNANAHEIAQTVENLMDFAIASADAESDHEEDIRISDLLAEILPVLEAANESKRLRLRLDLESAPAVFHARRRPIKSILVNLAGNAIKFTERGSVTIAIRLAGIDSGPAIEMEVSDTGPGIDHSKVARAFERWVQLSGATTRRHRGLGLGLAVVRHNATRLGAKLFVRTAPGQGSTFRLMIPVAAAASCQAKPSKRARMAHSEIGHHSHR